MKGAFTFLNKKIRIFKVELVKKIIKGTPGKILIIQGKGPFVVCNDFAIKLIKCSINIKILNTRINLSKKLKAAVIGLGVGEQHLIGYLKNSHVEVSAVCDIDEKNLEKFLVNIQLQKFLLVGKLLCEDLDIVSICSYDNYHAVQTCLALENGINCMVEKPIALNRKEAEKILIAYKKSKCILTSNLILEKVKGLNY